MERWTNGRLLSTTARLVEHAWNEQLRGLGLTHAGVIALDVLAVQGPMTQAMLAEIVSVQSQTIGKTLMRPEAHGHVRRQRNPSNRRSSVVSMTDSGAAARESARELEQSVLASVAVDTESLRKELKTIVRGLGARDATSRKIMVADSGVGIV
ncbi:MarR family transcriptional regulator [Arthrobacter sp. M4]|nr:MarR family transcriptional regulator [Arthrobacter sp. M4]